MTTFPWRILCIAFASTFLVNPSVFAADWRFYRGPDYNGVARETGWQAEFPASGPKVAWKKEVGIGAASFVVAGHRVITTGNVKDEDIVWCFNAEDGRELWTFRYACEFDERMFEGGTASTPTIDGDRVYNLSYDGQFQCLNLEDGSLVWKKHLVHDFGGEPSRWKYSSSPLVLGDRIFIDAGGDRHSTLAVDKMTGTMLWGKGDEKGGYSTPIPFTHGGVNGVLVFKGKYMLGLQQADGKKLFEIPWETSYDVNASSPFVVGDSFYVSSGYKTGRGALFAFNGNNPRKLWQNDDIKTKMSSCVPVGGYIYGITEKKGMLMCMDQKTGETVWEERGFGQYGTLTAADGKLITLTDSGELIFVEAIAKGFNRLAGGTVLEGRCWVNPVIANGRIYAKNNKGSMVCVDVSK